MTESMILSSIPKNTARRLGGKTALVYGDRRIPFAAFEDDSNRFANALVKLGVKTGDRVAMLQNSGPEFIVVFFGIMKAGAIAVPLDSRYVADELASLFNDCTPVLAVSEAALTKPLLEALPRSPSVKNIITVGEGADGQQIRYEKLIKENPSTPVKVKVAPEDIAIISYTGGPTFHPHGVALTHQSLVTEVISSVETFEQTEDDVFMLFALPMYHQFGLTAVLLASFYTGNTVVGVPGTGRSIESFMETIEREKGTVYCGVPYIYSLMINVAKRAGIKYNLSSLRLLASGGAPLEPIVIKQFKQYYGLDIRDIYGQTESICHCTVMPIHGTGKIGSSGKTLSCWEMKIFDANDNELPPGQEGEIVLRGPLMHSFWNQPQKTAEILRNGWLHTGDVGYIDEEGYLFITARSRRMIVLKGQNVFPSDIEAVIQTHPAVAEVKVGGVIDLTRGETISAYVKLKPGAAVTEHDLRQYCQGKMADYKLPRDIEFVDVMPDVLPLWRRRQYTDADAKLASLD
ncbi:MAG: AMP-binding protein [Dehalococcoidales bacterium]|nr:AMP-binding protein [Dehalococcoidales bacterium]